MADPSRLRQPPCRVTLIPSLACRVGELGVVALTCRMTFHVEVVMGEAPVGVPFAVDSAASVSVIGFEVARKFRIPLPPPEAETEVLLTSARSRSVVRVRPGRIRGWWSVDHAGHPFDWPVFFRPDVPRGVPALLGLGGVMATCRWTLDSAYSPDAPYGRLTLDDEEESIRRAPPSAAWPSREGSLAEHAG